MSDDICEYSALPYIEPIEPVANGNCFTQGSMLLDSSTQTERRGAFPPLHHWSPIESPE